MSSYPIIQMARSIGITYEKYTQLMKGLQDTVSYERGGKIMILDREPLDVMAVGLLDAIASEQSEQNV